MSPAHVLEPTYDAIRRRLIAGAWRPGLRLEAARLASDLGVSITPVRDSLNRLTGERLVHSTPGEGFQVPRLDGTELRGLIDWHRRLVFFACAVATDAWPAFIPHGHDGNAERTALLFGCLAAITEDLELEWALGNVAARIAPYRRHEDSILSDVSSELDEIEARLQSTDADAIHLAVDHYHRRRINIADQLVQLARK